MRRVAFLLLPEFSHLGLAAAVEPLFVANWLAQRPVFDWVLVSADGAPVMASNGMAVPVAGGLAAAEGAGSVFVLASFDPQSPVRNPAVLRWLRRAARFGTEMVGIENGSLVLAEAGLLDGHEAAVHWDNLAGFEECYPAVRAAARLYARSGDRVTCAGASAILDMMTAWIGWHGASALAAEVAEHLLFARPRAGETAQRGPALRRAAEGPDPAVAAAQALMRAHLDEPLPCAEIARRAGLSLRQIERRFALALGRTVAQEYIHQRMAKAHQLLQQTALGVTEIAFSCGFASPEYFSRLYRRTFGCAPSRDRRQSTTAPVMRLRPERQVKSRLDGTV